MPVGLVTKNYRHPSVLEALETIYHGRKCAYCETVESPGFVMQVDHYRPRDLYAWLTWEWTNLLFCCQQCNRKKSNQFPIQGARVGQPQADKQEWRADSVTFLAEKAMLIHPELEEPGDHLVFHPNGSIEAKNGSLRGKMTVEICGLDREALRIARKKVVDRFFQELQDALELFWQERDQNPALSKKEYLQILDERFGRLLYRIQQAQTATKPYARLGWHLQAEFERFFLRRLTPGNRLIVSLAIERYVA